MLEENIEHTDMFCALTNDDEVNIMSSLLAKQLGARQVMTLIGKPAYVDLVQGGEIDIAISPQQATTSSLLSHVRRGDVARAHTLRRGAAEALEVIAHGDAKVVGKAIGSTLICRAAVTIGAIVRGNRMFLLRTTTLSFRTGRPCDSVYGGQNPGSRRRKTLPGWLRLLLLSAATRAGNACTSPSYLRVTGILLSLFSMTMLLPIARGRVLSPMNPQLRAFGIAVWHHPLVWGYYYGRWCGR